jgi:hypothetical protein
MTSRGSTAMRLGGGAGLLDAWYGCLYGPLAQRDGVLAGGGEVDGGQAGEPGVVVAGQRQLSRYRGTCAGEHPHGADRCDVGELDDWPETGFRHTALASTGPVPHGCRVHAAGTT